ncbi:ADP-ribosyltransferase [Bacillus sp. CDB3]|uniref:ADP-ribosyltransferase n=1 Tax=Bacillus sp. CDB3 TaxID=360310 RepID=UPI0009D7DE1F|nr:ADP-ribosyltransferase [Bacillus sp. CDB3]OQR53448.1 hypothetical protein CDB3_29620 [Bacillus sp. CDB3]
MLKQKMMKVALCGAIATGVVGSFEAVKPSQVSAAVSWESTLEPVEKVAVKYYTGDGYAKINQELREGNINGSQSKYIKSIDQALKKAKTSEKMTVYRYADERQLGAKFGSLLQFKDLKLDSIDHIKNTQNYILEAKKLVEKWHNKTLTEKAYTSTSTQKVANFSARPILFEITVPKGTHAAKVEVISEFKNEKELLLPRNSKFKIEGSSFNAAEGYLVIKATLVN